MTPSWATKPIAVPVGSIAPTTPIKPNGAMASAMPVREKLRSWTISSDTMTSSIKGMTAKIDALPLAASSTTPPSAMR